jgi:hypothetical protein
LSSHTCWRPAAKTDIIKKDTIMKRAISIVFIAAATLALSLAPAAAKEKGHYKNSERHHTDRGWQQGWNNGYQSRGWNSRDVRGSFGFSDPSYNSDVRFRANPYRCTEDLGYGRYEYCGW